MGFWDYIRRKNLPKEYGPNVKPPLLVKKGLAKYGGRQDVKPNVHMRDMPPEQRRKELLKTRLFGPIYSRMKLASPFPVRKRK